MKQAILCAAAAVLLALLLPLLFAPIPDAHDAPLPASSADKDTVFTVQTDSGIRTVSLREYLPGVLAGEMPALFESEALKAQAVAARTYIMHRMTAASAAHPDADVCTDPACCKAYADEAALRQSWGDNYEAYIAKLTAAVTDTDGEYLTYAGAPIEAVFHSSSAGATEASESIWNPRPYLVSVESPETAADVPNFVTEVTVSAEELRSLVTSKHPEAAFPADSSQWLGEVKHSSGGRVEALTVGGVTLSGTELRSLLGLRSTSFTVAQTDGGFTFTVSGYGHGVGMSQYGANVYAQQGRGYREILAHYYPDTVLTEG